MNSTVRTAFTGFVPESIMISVFAGQGSGDRYKSRLEMKRTTGNVDQCIDGPNGPDQRIPFPGLPAGTRRHPRWFVPAFYRAPHVIFDATMRATHLAVALFAARRDYRDGFRAGAADRANGRPAAPESQSSRRSEGYRDGWDEVSALEARKAGGR